MVEAFDEATDAQRPLDLVSHYRHDGPRYLLPIFFNTTRSTRYENALEITWLAPDVQEVEGYRVLRGEMSGGLYELVGEVVNMHYSDLLLEQGQLYHYVV